MEIRNLTKDDLASLVKLYIQLDENNANISLEKARNVWDEIEANKNIQYIGAVDNGKVVSTCYFVIIPNLTKGSRSICFIENVVTDKDYRKQGLGKKVIQKAIEVAKENNCYKVILQSGVQRTEAHTFYEHIGFSGSTKKAFEMRLD